MGSLCNILIETEYRESDKLMLREEDWTSDQKKVVDLVWRDIGFGVVRA